MYADKTIYLNTIAYIHVYFSRKKIKLILVKYLHNIFHDSIKIKIKVLLLHGEMRRVRVSVRVDI